MNRRFASLALLMLLTVGTARAATLDQTFMNDFETNTIYLWSLDSANMRFDGFSTGANMAAWNAQVSTADRLVLSGPTLAAGAGRFNLHMHYSSAPFRLEWAEVFFNKVENVVLGRGTLTFDGNGWSNSAFASHSIDMPLNPTVAALPLPGSAMMMLSALLLLTVPTLRQRLMV